MATDKHRRGGRRPAARIRKRPTTGSGSSGAGARAGPRRGLPPRPGEPGAQASSKPRSVEEEVRATARPGQGDRAVRAFEQAVSLVERGRDAAAVRSAQEAKELAPRSGAVREILGIALYRAERFREALRELQAYRRITGRLDQNHLIADSHRALGAPAKALEPVREALRARIPDDVRAEAAIVGASALADLGRFEEALSLVRSASTARGGAKESDVRLWYATADLLARAGRPREAVQEFRKILRYDSGAFDVAERLAALS